MGHLICFYVIPLRSLNDANPCWQVIFIDFEFIITEITSRITIYRDQGAFVLFVVYDNDDFIVNDEEFIRDLEKHDKIRVIVVR